MTWKTIETVNIVNREGETEDLKIQYDGNYYRIQNSFGNINLEFDVSSGFELADKLSSIIESDINEEIMNFLNQKDIEEDENNAKVKQMSLFSNSKNLQNKINPKTKEALTQTKSWK